MLLPDKPEAKPDRRKTDFVRKGPYGKPVDPKKKYNGGERNRPNAEFRSFEADQKHSKRKLSPETKARLLDAEHLDRFEIDSKKKDYGFEGGSRKGERRYENHSRKNDRGFSDRPARNFDRRSNHKPNQKKHHS